MAGGHVTASDLGAAAQPVVSAPDGHRILSDSQWQNIAQSLSLSRRESQILQGLFDDATEATIASDLGISVHTVHTYLERLYRKLGVTSRNAAIVRAFGEVLRCISPPSPGAPVA